MAFDTDPPHILSASEIWAAKDIEERVVPVPQWGGAVRIRTFSKRQADKMRLAATTKDRYTNKETLDNERLEALLFCEGVIDPHFEVEDYERLQDKSAAAVGLILKAILDASGLSELAVTEATKSPDTGRLVALRVSSSARAENDAGGIAHADVSE